ncbi:MAG: tRNA dihydrouridine(20/20a) synthase DusA [Proteobacteria bacterium]|nr:tRNA dihydrouridine(20/20a) synthase DusA [Pseudomonadota bacterium]MDA0852631.1 tRNA dihydrouridine(20/20a) synthase DusA [Pseudomonadota bacterium]MDA1295360.1 tRNA dihydrouridine(20/20a) synthase DusA [Pseudomonadota bacterium]
MNTAAKHITAKRLSIAPMMDWTDRHCRYFHRLLSKNALLYTEMVTSAALVRGGALHLLEYSAEEHPVALQLGGSDPKELAKAAQLAEQAGYCEVNLNVGCPSDRVQSGSFGAVLMKTPDLVAECCSAMREAVDIEVTVKCRIGVDDQEPKEVLPDFLSRVSAGGVSRFIIHARKAWLQGLSPKENRDIPPLDYDLVHAMKGEFPDLHLSLNGGIGSLKEAKAALNAGLDGVMIGRAAYQRPYDILAGIDEEIFGDTGRVCSKEVVRQMLPYIERHLKDGGKLNQITRHMLGLFAGQGGARIWRRMLSERGHNSGAELVLEALSHITPQVPELHHRPAHLRMLS